MNIDSIVLSDDIKIHKPIPSGDSLTLEMNRQKINGEGANVLTVFLNNKKFISLWGLHDFDRFTNAKEEFFVFSHGINRIDQPLKIPEEMKIIIVNESIFSIDSIFTKNNSLLKEYTCGNNYYLSLDFQKFSEQPFLKIFTKNKIADISIKHDWENWNWNQNQTIIYLKENGNFEQAE